MTPIRQTSSDIFDRARDVPISDVAARIPDLRRQGHELISPCPACGGTDRFSIHPTKQVFLCRGCLPKGGRGVIDLAAHAYGIAPRQAAEWLVGEVGISPRQHESDRGRHQTADRAGRDQAARQHDADQRAKARWLWSRRMSITEGSLPVVTCHVDNVVEAVQCALHRGPGGRAYFIHDQETMTFRAFVAMLAGRKGLSIEGVGSVPYWLAFTLGRLMEIGAVIMRSKSDPPLSRTLVRLIGREFVTDDSAARHELGYVGRVSRAEGLAAYGETEAHSGSISI